MGFLTNLVEQKQRQESEEALSKAQELKFLVDNHPDPKIQGRAMEGLIKAAGLSAKEGQNLLGLMSHLSNLAGNTVGDLPGSIGTFAGQVPEGSLPPAKAGETPATAAPAVGSAGEPVSAPTPSASLPVQYVLDPNLQPTALRRDLRKMTGAEGEEFERPPSVSVPTSRMAQDIPVTGPEAPPVAQPKKPGFWRSLGQLGLETLAGGLSGGKTVEEQYHKEEQERQEQYRERLEEQQSRLRMGEAAQREQLAKATALDPELRNAAIEDYRKQLIEKGIVERIEQGKYITQFENMVRDEIAKGTEPEEAYRRVAMKLTGQYHPPTLTVKPVGAPKLVVDPDDPKKRRWQQEYTDGSTKLLPGYAPPPREELTGQVKELADAKRIIASPGSSSEEKAAAKMFIDKYNAEIQGALTRNVNIASTAEDAPLIADAIEQGIQPPTLVGLARSGLAAKVRGELAKRGFNLVQAENDWRSTQRWLATMNSQMQVRLRQATDFAFTSLDLIDELSDEVSKKVPRGQYPVLNRAALIAAKGGLFGQDAQEAATNLDVQIRDLQGELAQVYKGGTSPTDIGLKQAQDILNSSWSHNQLKKAVALARTNLRIRLNSIGMAGPLGVSPQSPYLPPTTPPETSPAPGGGTVRIESGGKQYDIPTDSLPEARRRDPNLKVLSGGH
jgi:hypothetical protein